MSVTPEDCAIITGRKSIAMCRDDTNPDYNRMMCDLTLALYNDLRRLNPTHMECQKHYFGFFHIICTIGNLNLHYYIRINQNATMEDLLTCMHVSASKHAIDKMTDYVRRFKQYEFESFDLSNTYEEEYYHIEA